MCVEELSKVCGTTGVIVSAHTSLCVDPILTFGTPEQKEKYVPDWAPFNDGYADFERCFKALKDVGYDGYVTFEDFSSAETSDQKLKTNIELIRGIVDKVWAE